VIRKMLPFALLALLALGLLAACDQLPSIEAAAIIGSINLDPNDEEGTHGGTVYHVLVYEAGTDVDPDFPATVNELVPVAETEGTFPGTESDWYFTINYVITDVPAGTYYALVWIDYDNSGDFDLGDGDYFGFYERNSDGTALWEQPYSPNVVVPETGLLDIDIWCVYEMAV
jgi:hypothetical protein